jgi:hypothetical protein
VPQLTKSSWDVSSVSWLKITDVSGTICFHYQGCDGDETYVIFNQLTRLISQEDFIFIRRRESFRSYIHILVYSALGPAAHLAGTDRVPS